MLDRKGIAVLDILVEGQGRVSHLKLCKGKRVYNKGDIPPSNISRQLAGQQPGVGASNVDVRMEFHPQGVDRLLPTRYFLYFVKKQIELLFAVANFLTYIIVESVVLAKVLVAQVLKVQEYGVGAVDLVTDLLQQDAFTAAPDASQYLDDVLADEGADFGQMVLSNDHGCQLLS